MRILIVEDEHRIATAIKKGLEQEHFAVDVAFTGNTGLDLASSETYDLMIFDVLLPEMDGIALCKTLRSQGIHTPILLLSAKNQIEDKIAGLDCGADDYMTKPFSFEELLARLRSLLRRPAHIVEPILSVGTLTLDPKTYAVKRSGQDIHLSNKEFSLLHYLMRHTGQTLKKDVIIAHVWDFSADILPNTLEVTMKNLRGKVDKAFPAEHPLLHTMRGYGYMIGEK